MAVTGHYFETLLFLGYLALPLVAYFVYWLFKLFRRGKEGETEGAESES